MELVCHTVTHCKVHASFATQHRICVLTFQPAFAHAGLVNVTTEQEVYVMLTPPKVNVSSVPSM